MNYMKLIFIQTEDHFFDIITKRSFFYFPFFTFSVHNSYGKPNQALSFSKHALMAS